ncbi:MAG TPA: hypothetical protein VGF48_21435 [Thermoanaerobaculia bacterium]|jgi:hypothetical protein
MKTRILFVVLAAFIALSAIGQPLESVLTPDGALFTLDSIAEGQALALNRRAGSERDTIIIPATAGEELDHDGRLLYDHATSTLFVLFRRASGDIVLTSMSGEGVWSDEHVLSLGDGTLRTGLRVALTHDQEDHASLSFVHAIWWEQGEKLLPRYGLVAYDGVEHLSTYVGSLIEVANGIRNGSDREGSAPEDSLPLLAISATAKEADVVFGSLETPTATRLRILPKKRGEARIYIPIGRTGGGMPHPKFASASNGNAQVMMVGDRIVVYSAAASSFRFSVYDAGQWGPVRSLKLDETMTARQVESALRRAVSEYHTSAEVVHE